VSHNAQLGVSSPDHDTNQLAPNIDGMDVDDGSSSCSSPPSTEGATTVTLLPTYQEVLSLYNSLCGTRIEEESIFAGESSMADNVKNVQPLCEIGSKDMTVQAMPSIGVTKRTVEEARYCTAAPIAVSNTYDTVRRLENPTVDVTSSLRDILASPVASQDPAPSYVLDNALDIECRLDDIGVPMESELEYNLQNILPNPSPIAPITLNSCKSTIAREGELQVGRMCEASLHSTYSELSLVGPGIPEPASLSGSQEHPNDGCYPRNGDMFVAPWGPGQVSLGDCVGVCPNADYGTPIPERQHASSSTNI